MILYIVELENNAATSFRKKYASTRKLLLYTPDTLETGDDVQEAPSNLVPFSDKKLHKLVARLIEPPPPKNST